MAEPVPEHEPPPHHRLLPHPARQHGGLENAVAVQHEDPGLDAAALGQVPPQAGTAGPARARHVQLGPARLAARNQRSKHHGEAHPVDGWIGEAQLFVRDLAGDQRAGLLGPDEHVDGVRPGPQHVVRHHRLVVRPHPGLEQPGDGGLGRVEGRLHGLRRGDRAGGLLGLVVERAVGEHLQLLQGGRLGHRVPEGLDVGAVLAGAEPQLRGQRRLRERVDLRREQDPPLERGGERHVEGVPVRDEPEQEPYAVGHGVHVVRGGDCGGDGAGRRPHERQVGVEHGPRPARLPHADDGAREVPPDVHRGGGLTRGGPQHEDVHAAGVHAHVGQVEQVRRHGPVVLLGAEGVAELVVRHADAGGPVPGPAAQRSRRPAHREDRGADPGVGEQPWHHLGRDHVPGHHQAQRRLLAARGRLGVEPPGQRGAVRRWWERTPVRREVPRDEAVGRTSLVALAAGRARPGRRREVEPAEDDSLRWVGCGGGPGVQVGSGEGRGVREHSYPIPPGYGNPAGSGVSSTWVRSAASASA